MMPFRNASGEIQFTDAPATLGPGWTALPATPNGLPDGWRWTGAAWQPIGPRLWRQVEFVRRLLTPAEVLAAETVVPDTTERQLFRWANSVASRVDIVDLDNANTIALIQLAVAVGVLTPARAEQVLAGIEP
jgi:hypothetical protein